MTVPAEAEITSGVIVIGDSISYYSTPEILNRRPNWNINAQRGREVNRLPFIINSMNTDGLVYRAVVIELGTNISDGWSKSDYEAAVAALPGETKKFFVVPRVHHQGWERNATVNRYGDWMEQIAAVRADTFIIDWRAEVNANPDLLPDGVHPNQEGQNILARIMAYAVANN